MSATPFEVEPLYCRYNRLQTVTFYDLLHVMQFRYSEPAAGDNNEHPEHAAATDGRKEALARAAVEVEKMEKQDSSGEQQDERVSKATKIFETFIQACLAEVLGTMFFVFITCVSVIENEPETGRLKPALVYGLAMTVLVALMDKIRQVS